MNTRLATLPLFLVLSTTPAWADIFRGNMMYTVTSVTFDGLPGMLNGLAVGDSFTGSYQYESPTVDFELVSGGLFSGALELPNAPDVFVIRQFLINSPTFALAQFEVVDGHVTTFLWDDEGPGLDHVHICLCGVDSEGRFPAPGSPTQIWMQSRTFNRFDADIRVAGTFEIEDPTRVPELSTIFLLGIGVVGLKLAVANGAQSERPIRSSPSQNGTRLLRSFLGKEPK